MLLAQAEKWPTIRLVIILAGLSTFAFLPISCSRQQQQRHHHNLQHQQQQQQQQNDDLASVGEEDSPIVINSKHSGNWLPANRQTTTTTFGNQQQRRSSQQSTNQQQTNIGRQPQPSQEFDATYSANLSPNYAPSGSTGSQPERRRPSEPYVAAATAWPAVGSSSMIRDTSALSAANQLLHHDDSMLLELEQRRGPAEVTTTSKTTTTTTESSWMQSVRDNHHGPLRSRFNLVAGSTLLAGAGNSPAFNTRRLVSGEQVSPVGDTLDHLLVHDGHMKPGPSQPVPYEQQQLQQQFLAKLVRTEQPTTTTTTTTTLTDAQTVQPSSSSSVAPRRNSKFTRRSTEYVSSDTTITTPLYLAPSLATKRPSEADSNKTKSRGNPHEKTQVRLTTDSQLGNSSNKVVADKTKLVPDLKMILLSNNHRPTAGADGKLLKSKLHANTKRGARKLAADSEDIKDQQKVDSRESPSANEFYQPSEHRQQKKKKQQQQQTVTGEGGAGWSRLLPNLFQRTINSVFKRLTTTANLPPSNSGNQQVTAAQNLFNSFAAPPPNGVQFPATQPVIPTTPSPHGVANFIASALSAAFAAAAASNSNHKPNLAAKVQQHHHPILPADEHNQLMSDAAAAAAGQHHLFNQQQQQQMGSNSMRHETREPDLRQHANKKIIDSFDDLPVSERRTTNHSIMIDRRDGLISSSNSSQRQARMSPEDPLDEQVEFELDQQTLAKGNGSWSLELTKEPAADFYLGSNLTDSQQLNSDSLASVNQEDPEDEDRAEDQLDFRTTTDSSGADDADLSESDQDALEAADSVIVPEQAAYEVAQNLGEPAIMSSSSNYADAESNYPADEEEIYHANEEDDDNLASEQDNNNNGFSLFYAPAPSNLMSKSYRASESSSLSDDFVESQGEGSFARIVPISSTLNSQHSNQKHRNRNKIRRPQVTPIEPTPFHASDQDDDDDGDDMEGEDNMSGPMTLMMVPARKRLPPARRRVQSSQLSKPHKRPNSGKPISVPAISLKETRKPVNTNANNRNRNKVTTSTKPTGAQIFNQPKVTNPAKRDEMMSPMSSSISVMDLDPSMTRLAHNKLIVAKYKPNKLRLHQRISPKANLLHRSTIVEQSQQKQTPASTRTSSSSSPLGLALLGHQNSLSDNLGNLNEFVSRRWQVKPPRPPQPTTTTTTEAPVTPSQSQQSEQVENSTSRSEPDSDGPLRSVSNFQFLMPGLASGLAARISSLTRPPTSTTTTTTQTPTSASSTIIWPEVQSSNQRDSNSDQQAPVNQGPPSMQPTAAPSSMMSQQSYVGNRNDKFNFSLIQMNNRERINPLLFPIERFSNSSSYSLQQHQKEQNRNKPSNHRSRLTTTSTTVRPTTIRAQNSTTGEANNGTTTTTTVPPPPPKQQVLVRTTRQPVYVRSTTTTTGRPKTTAQQRTTSSSTTKPTTADDGESLGQILRNQHHQTTFGHMQRPMRPANRPPMTESERLRNQYQALIGKNSSLDGRIWPPPPGEAVETSSSNPLGHMSLVEAAHDSNKYTTLDASPPAAAAAAAGEEDPLNEHDSIVILSDNHHHKQQTGSNRLGSQFSSPRLPPFNAGHTRYELSSKPIIQTETARKYLEEFVNGTRIRPSSMSKLVTMAPHSTPSPANITQQLINNRRSAQQSSGAFNSVQGSPPASPANDNLIGRLDLRAEELLFDVFNRDPSYSSQKGNSRRHQENSSMNNSDVDFAERIKTHSTITLSPVPIGSAASSTQAQLSAKKNSEHHETTSTEPPSSTSSSEITATGGGGEPERAYLDLGESGDLNNRASMRKNQAKIQSILAVLANKNRTTSTTTQASASMANNEDDTDANQEDQLQEFKTTLDYSSQSLSSLASQEDQMETTKFYAPIKLTTRSSSYYGAPPMSTPAPGRPGGYPIIETLSGSRQKINPKPVNLDVPTGNNFEYSQPTSSTMEPSSQAPTTKLTESLTNDSQLRQTIKNRIGAGSPYQADTTQSTTPAGIDTSPSGTEMTPNQDESSVAGDQGSPIPTDAADDLGTRRRPEPQSNAVDVMSDYPEMPTFPQNKPPRPVIIRRKPTRRPPPQRLAIGGGSNENSDDTERPALIVASDKPRRKKKPSKRPVASSQVDRESADEHSGGYDSAANNSNDKRKIIYRPVVNELGESPVIIRKRPSYLVRLPTPPDNIRIHPSPLNNHEQQQRNRTHPHRPTASGISAPVSIMLPAMESVQQLKKKDHDIRTRPLTIMDPAGSDSGSQSGDHLSNEAILNPTILTRIPETTIIHDKMLVSYKPGRPLPGSMSSFGPGKPTKPGHDDPSPSSPNPGETLMGSATSVAPNSSLASGGNSSLSRPPQLGSGNGGDTHLISIEQQQREQQTTRRPLLTTASSLLLPLEQQLSGSTSSMDHSTISTPSSGLSMNSSLTSAPPPLVPHNNNNNHRPIIVISGLFGNPENTSNYEPTHQAKPTGSSHESPHQFQPHQKRPSSTTLGSNSLLEAGSMSVVAQASHGQANSSRPWYPTASVSGWPNKHQHNNSLINSSGQDSQLNNNNSNSSMDLSGSQSSSVEQSVFGGSEMPNFGGGSSSSPSGSYQNHHLQHQQHIGMPYQGYGGSLSPGGSRPGQRPNRWRVRRRPQSNGGPSSSGNGGGGGGGSSSAGYNFNSASSVSNYVYRPLLNSVNSFGALIDNAQIFFARVRTFIISLMVMFLPPLALAASIVNAMSV